MHLVIIGNGITGTTVARYVRKATDWKITIISSETEYFFSRTALMYIYMGHMKYEHTKPYEDSFWEENDLNLIYDHVTEIEISQKMLRLRNGAPVSYDKLVLATGSKPNKFGWPGENLSGVQGLYSYDDLQLMEDNTHGIERGVVVGGGLIGVEVAEMLDTRNIPVTFLVREENYWDNALPPEEAKLAGREIRRHGIDLRLETELKEILPGKNGRVRAVVTEDGEEIACQFVALTPGVHPNIELVKDGPIETGRGIRVNHFFETSEPDVYAAGDCAEFTDAEEDDPAIEQLWYTGRMQGEALARLLCGGDQPYDRGIWFNSAKFFNIEYQTYGRVPPQLPEKHDTFYWEDEDGQKCLRVNFRQEDRSVTGFNAFGLRLRQRVCEKWIENRSTLENVIEHLGEAAFDPEFSSLYEKSVLKEYHRKYPDRAPLKQKRKRGLFGLFQFENRETA